MSPRLSYPQLRFQRLNGKLPIASVYVELARDFEESFVTVDGNSQAIQAKCTGVSRFSLSMPPRVRE